MLKFLALIKLMPSLIQILIASIVAVEEAIPGRGAGEEKLAAVRAMLEGAFSVAEGLSNSFDDIWAMAKPAIASVVALFNKRGWPTQTEPSPAEPQA